MLVASAWNSDRVSYKLWFKKCCAHPYVWHIMNITSGIMYRYQDGMFLLREHVFSFTCTPVRGTFIGQYNGNCLASSFQPYSGLNGFWAQKHFPKFCKTSLHPSNLKSCQRNENRAWSQVNIHLTSVRRGYISGLSKLAPTKNKLFPLLLLSHLTRTENNQVIFRGDSIFFNSFLFSVNFSRKCSVYFFDTIQHN